LHLKQKSGRKGQTKGRVRQAKKKRSEKGRKHVFGYFWQKKKAEKNSGDMGV